MKKITLLFIYLLLLGCPIKKEKQLKTINKTCFSKDITITRTLPNTNSKKELIIDKKRIGNDVFEKDKDLKISFKDFNLVFKDVNSIDNPEDDFGITNTLDSIYIKRNFLESDELYSKKITIESKEIDSLNIKGIYYNDFVFTGQEKKKTPLRLNIIDSLSLNFESGFFLPYKINNFKPIINDDIIERSKCINVKYFKKVSTSDNYGDTDKVSAIKSIEKLTKNEYKNLDDLFISYSNIKYVMKITYYIKNKKKIKIIIYNNN